MKLGIIGLPGSGKTTIFNALTGGHAAVSTGGRSRETNVAVVKVPDERVGRLSAIYEPQKTIYAQVEYSDVGGIEGSAEKNKPLDDKMLNLLRPMDALVLVARNFVSAGIEPTPRGDIRQVESDLIIADLVVVEKRLTRIEEDVKRGKKGNEEERDLLKQCLRSLEDEIPIRAVQEVVSSNTLKGFAFLSAKPMVWVINNQETGGTPLGPIEVPANTAAVEICGKLEMELAQLSADEARMFRSDLAIASEPALERLIRDSYALLGLISFFTVGKDEVRAWTVRKETPAQSAAGVIHSDIEKGFIRAEVISYDDLLEFGSFAQAQKKGKVRLEGRDYAVQDGDIMNFRFNV